MNSHLGATNTVRIRPILTGISGIFTTLLGLLVVVGWHTQTSALIQIRPAFVPMQFNAALGFVLAGIGVLSLFCTRPRAAGVCGALVFMLGLTTLHQYLFDVNIGIDELLMEHYIAVKTSHPGRMAPNTALSFMLSGAALAIVGFTVFRPYSYMLLAIMSSLVVLVGTIALVGYWSGVETAYGWRSLTQMAVHTATGFTVLGAGMFAYSWQGRKSQIKQIPIWLPFPAGVASLVVAILFWRALIEYDRVQMDRIIDGCVDELRAAIREFTAERILALTRMAGRWEIQDRSPRAQWEADALDYMDHYSGFHAIAWVDPSLTVRWIVPMKGNEAVENLNLRFDERCRNALTEARDRRKVTVTRSLDMVQGGKGFAVFVPLFLDDRADGFIAGVFRFQEFVDTVLRRTAGMAVISDYSIALYDGTVKIYSRGDPASNESRLTRTRTIPIGDVAWRLHVRPGAGLPARRQSLLPEVTLAVGLIMAALISGIVYLAQSAYRNASLLAKTNMSLAAEIDAREGTERKLKALTETQEARIAERTAELSAVNQRLAAEVANHKKTAEVLRDRNQELQDFAYSVSHDLKAPVRTIRSFSEIVASRHRTSLNDEGRRYFDHIHKAGVNMDQLIEDLLRYSRLGRKSVSMQPVFLKTVFAEVADMLDDRLKQCRAELSVPDNLPTVQGDAALLRQIFSNLVDNALSYRRQDVTPKVDVSWRRDGDRVIVSIADNGVGIPTEFQKKVFEMFQRLHSVDNYPGTGIGLALVKKACGILDGRVWLDSVVGEGSTFHVELMMGCEA